MFKPLPDPKLFGRVAVLMGGWSAERDVSLKSGHAVLEALLRQGVDAHGVDVTTDNVLELKQQGFDRVFNVVHGRGGEDGHLQALLELMELPYTGSGILGCALSMDKLRAKQLWKGLGLKTPNHLVLTSKEDCLGVEAELGFPVMIKPALEGSSIGISKVHSAQGLEEAYEKAAVYGHVFAEKFIEGGEYTASILLGQALPVIKLETDQDFYDYEAKYQRNDTRYICPCGLSEDQENAVKEIAITAFDAAGGTGWGRVDFMIDQSGCAWLIEMNSVPGMTDHSLVPMAAKRIGISYDELVCHILTTTIVT